MPVRKPKGAKTYWYRFKENKVPYEGNTHLADEAEAQTFEDTLRAKIRADNTDHEARQAETAAALKVLGLNAPTSGGSLTIAKAVESYFDHAGRGAKNHVEEKNYFEWIKGYFGPDKLLIAITESDAIKMRQARADMPKRSRCAKRLPQVLDRNTRKKRFFDSKKDHERDIIKIGPGQVNRSAVDLLRRLHEHASDDLKVVGLQPIKWSNVRQKEPDPPKTRMSYAEEAVLLEAMREGYGAAFKFALLSGLRLENFSELRWDQINFLRREVFVVQKGEDAHEIPITDEMMEILKAQRGKHPFYVFTFIYTEKSRWTNPKNGKVYVRGGTYPVTYWGFRSWFTRYMAAKEMPHLTVHDLRRTAGSRILTESGNLQLASEILGHSSTTTTTRHYSHMDNEEKLDAMREAQQRVAAKRATAAVAAKAAEDADATETAPVEP
jgi:integrase